MIMVGRGFLMLAIFSSMLLQWGACQVWANQTKAPFLKHLICYSCEGFDVSLPESHALNNRACLSGDHFVATAVGVNSFSTNEKEEDFQCYKMTVDNYDWNNGTEWVARGIVKRQPNQDSLNKLILNDFGSDRLPFNYNGSYHFHYCDTDHCNSATAASATVLTTIVSLLSAVRVF